MALDYTAVYPGQLDPGDPTGYPYGEARNVTVPGDGTGWPMERQWVNDLLGFEQALLDAAGITPSGAPDKVGASDYLDALNELINSHAFTAGLTVAGGFALAGGGTIAGDVEFQSGDVTFNNGVLIGTSLQVNGAVTLGNATTDLVTVTGLADIRELGVSTSATVNGDVNIGGDLVLLGAATLADAATFNGPATFKDTATFNSGIAMGSALVAGTLAMTGAGHVRGRFVTLTDANVSKGIADGDYFSMPNAVLSGTKTLTLSHTGAAAGDMIQVVNHDVNDTLVVDDQLGANLANLRTASGFAYAITCVFDGAQWRNHTTINA